MLVVECDKVTTKFTLLPAFVVTLLILIVGITIIVPTPVVVPAFAIVIEDKFILKVLPPPEVCVVTAVNVTDVWPAAIVAVPAVEV